MSHMVLGATLSVLLIFGENLRLLCTTRPSIAAVCRDLDINRVQFNRYMSGHSFPKPNILQKMCDYFRVDARIYTLPLTSDDIEALKSGGDLRSMNFQTRSRLGFVDYLDMGGDVVPNRDTIPDSVHSFWRRSFLDPEKYLRTLVSIKTVDGVRVFRGKELISLFSATERLRGNVTTRDYRGVMIKSSAGYNFPMLNAPPSHLFAVTFVSHNLVGSRYRAGFHAIGQEESLGRKRMVRSVLEILPQDTSSILAAARLCRSRLVEDELPYVVRDLITPPLREF